MVSGTWAPYPYVSNISKRTVEDENGNSIVIYGLGPAYRTKRLNATQAIKKVHGVDIYYTNDRSMWTRVPVIEVSEDQGLAEGNVPKHELRAGLSWNLQGGELVRDGSRTGWSYFPGYAIDVETGERLNMYFTENSWLVSERGHDMLFNPTATLTSLPNTVNGGYVFGGQHSVHVMTPRDSIFDASFNKVPIENVYQGDNPEDHPLYDLINDLDGGNIARRNFYDLTMWSSYQTLAFGQEDFDISRDGIPTNAKISVRLDYRYGNQVVDNSNNGNPRYEFTTGNIATKKMVTSVAESALDNIRAVPNPYYGWSEYETSQLDNTVRLTNLPEQCKISIFSTNGTLVRTINKDNTLTFVEWDLTNQFRVPIASGVYIIHIDAPGIGEKVIKWFGALRPVDLNAF